MKISLLISTLAIITACGKNAKQNQENPQDENVQGQAVESSSDLELAAEEVSSDIELALESIADTGSSESVSVSSQGLSFGLAATGKSMKLLRSCENTDLGADVSIKRLLKNGARIARSGLKAERTIEITRNWDGVSCAEDKPWVALDYANIAGVSFEEQRNVTVTRDVKIGKRKAEQTRTATGTRSVEALSSIEEDAGYIVDKSISFNYSSEQTIVTPSDKSFNRSYSVETLENMLVSDSIDKDSKKVTSRLITSGTIKRTGKNGGSTEITFDNVRFAQNALCKSEEGTISGKIFKAGSEEADATFEVSMANEQATITFGNGEVKTLDLAACPLDEDDSEVEEVQSEEELVAEETAEEATETLAE